MFTKFGEIFPQRLKEHSLFLNKSKTVNLFEGNLEDQSPGAELQDRKLESHNEVVNILPVLKFS